LQYAVAADNQPFSRSKTMLVRFLSSETGELLMYADSAGALLRILGKATTARGSFLQSEMQAAALVLRQAVQESEQAGQAPVEDDDENVHFMDKPVVLGQRAWPFIDMLERTGRAGPKANILWEAAGDF
jgi:hypothetical protein